MMARRYKTLQYALEGVLLWTGMALFRVLPFRAAVWLAEGAAGAAFFFLRRRRAIAVTNILKAGIRAERPAAVALARQSFRHFAVSAVETLRLLGLPAERWRQHVRADWPKALKAHAAERKQGLVLAGAHVGNWEVGTLAFAELMPVAGIARPFDNPLAERRLRRVRFGGKVRILPKHGEDTGRLLEPLRDREALAIMVDQHAGRRGLIVPFLGRPASTHASVALLPMVTKAPLYFGYCLRTGPMAFRCAVVGPIPCPTTGDKEADLRGVLLRLNAEVEKVIRAAPEQYLWGHRRWRPQDEERAAAGR